MISLISIYKCISVFANPSLHSVPPYVGRKYQHLLSVVLDFVIAVLGVFPVYEVLLWLVWEVANPLVLNFVGGLLILVWAAPTCTLFVIGGISLFISILVTALLSCHNFVSSFLLLYFTESQWVHETHLLAVCFL